MTPRRELTAVLGVGALASAALLAVTTRPWLDLGITRPAPFASLTLAIAGRREFPAIAGLAVATLLGSAGAAVTARTVRTLIGMVIALAGFGATVLAVRALAEPPSGRARELAGDRASGTSVLSIHRVDGWPVVAAVLAVLIGLVGVAAVLRGRRWSGGLSSRYQAPNAERTSAHKSDPWRTLDRGDDPTITDR